MKLWEYGLVYAYYMMSQTTFSSFELRDTLKNIKMASIFCTMFEFFNTDKECPSDSETSLR